MGYRDDDNEAHDFGECVCVAETEKALGVKVAADKDDELFWVPKSVVHDDSEVWKKSDEGRLLTKLWWAEKNGHA